MGESILFSEQRGGDLTTHTLALQRPNLRRNQLIKDEETPPSLMSLQERGGPHLEGPLRRGEEPSWSLDHALPERLRDPRRTNERGE